MLIRWATIYDIPMWEALSKEYDPYISVISTDFGKWYQGFFEFMNRKIKQHEAVLAVDRMSENCNGVIAFSRSHNRITFFAISPTANHAETAGKLLKVALRQLNTNLDIIINLPLSDAKVLGADRRFFDNNSFEFIKEINIDGCPMAELVRKADNNKRGGSFHYRYPEFIKAAHKENCPVCNAEPAPDLEIDIAESDMAWFCGQYPGQGRLFGKMYVMPKSHAFHFEDMTDAEAAAFMCEVKRAGKALRKITGAIKINYEMHSNSGAHLHIHLFPRYLDDDFPSAPIDYRVSEPAPYESYDEYLWFVEQMRKELKYNVQSCELPSLNSPDRETDEERQARIYPVILSEYNPAWPEWFAEEKKNLERLIGAENIVRILHIGSTSVPGLMAKPTVDIQIDIIEDMDADELVKMFPHPYICLYPPDMSTPPPHLMVLKGYTATGFADKVFHIHFRYPGDDDRLIFRNYLIAHPEAANEYAALKLKLKDEFEHNRDGYTYAKGEFIKDIMKKARGEMSI